MTSRARRLLPLALLLAACGCQQKGSRSSGMRSEAVSSASAEMSGPSLFSEEPLMRAVDALRAEAGGKVLRLEIRAREILMQVEDPNAPGTVLEYHYREGKLSEPEHATLRGKGKLEDNLFELDQVKLEAIPQLTREAVRRVDAESGRVDSVLVRRNLPDSEEVLLRVYVSSPRRSGYLDADRSGRPLE